jgi:hypothetical protein
LKYLLVHNDLRRNTIITNHGDVRHDVNKEMSYQEPLAADVERALCLVVACSARTATAHFDRWWRLLNSLQLLDMMLILSVGGW